MSNNRSDERAPREISASSDLRGAGAAPPRTPSDRHTLPRSVPAFFRMHCTLLTIDTGMSWMRFLRARGEIGRAFVAQAVWWSTLYKLALLDMETLAARLVADLAGDLEAEMIAKC